MTEEMVAEASALGLRVIEIDGKQGIGEVCGCVALSLGLSGN